MSKKITKANIIGELVEKFGLVEHEREDFLFGEYVLPTYDIGSHTKNWVSHEFRKAVSANGMLSMCGVPQRERWSVRRVDILHEAGANFDIDQVLFYSSPTRHQYLFYDTVAPITSGTVKIFDLPQDFVMESQTIAGLEYLYINVANYVAGGYVSINILSENEEIR